MKFSPRSKIDTHRYTYIQTHMQKYAYKDTSTFLETCTHISLQGSLAIITFETTEVAYAGCHVICLLLCPVMCKDLEDLDAGG